MPTSGAQQIPDAEPPLLRIESKLVQLDVIVADHKTGRQLTTLDANDFLLDEDGTPQKIQSFSRDSLPFSIVLLFDLTDSVRSSLKTLAASAQVALAQLKPEDEIAVMTFSSSTQLLQPFTHDREAVAAAIQKAAEGKSKDATFLDEDVYEAAEVARQASTPGSRRALVFFTDGTSNYVNAVTRKMSKNAPAQLHTRQQALDHLLRNDVSVAALIDRSHLSQAATGAAAANPFSFLLGVNPRLNDVQRYAEQTGGPALVGNSQEVAQKLAALIEQIRGRYTISYVPATPRPSGTFCRLHLRLAPEAIAQHSELHQGRFDIRARTGYYR